MKKIYIMRKILFLLLQFTSIELILGCNKVPYQVPYSTRKSGDNGYRLIIGDEPNGYKPGNIYNIFLLGARTHDNLQQFTHFILSAKSSSENGNNRKRLSTPNRIGRFQLFSDALTKFHENCINSVLEADDLPKSEVQIMWVAPPTGSGCIALSAMVYENAHSWYSDDGNLTKIICEDTQEEKYLIGECCACDEAKYTFTFEGIWSNETHPRDYPFAIWLTHFSDVIGASHDANFSFWGENHIATDGFRSLAEWGSVRLMETELRAKGSRLRTLIKAAGLWYPHVNANTSSHFRVDRKHNKLSLVSMFGPSPDWVVGINGLNLCEQNCSWKSYIDIDLYPWDAGTDNGITYMSPNSETQPRERMYRITPMYPEDPRQPFYNTKSPKMKPLAKLYIRREKVIARNCDEEFLQSQVLDVSENTEEISRPECDVTPYTHWSSCSVSCGKGIRMRNREYLNISLAKLAQCNRQLIGKEMCVAVILECNGDEQEKSDDDDDNLANTSANVNEDGEGVGICITTKWSEWSPCSATCGIGISMRTRTFVEHGGRKKCPHITIVEKEKCMTPECSITDMEIPDPMCPVTIWSDWSPCSQTCGRGVRIRTRLLLVDADVIEMCSRRMELHQQQVCAERQSCIYDSQTAKEICSKAYEVGPCRGKYDRYAFNYERERCEQFVYGGCRGNRNNFLSFNDCMDICKNNDDVRRSQPVTYFETTSRANQSENGNNRYEIDDGDGSNVFHLDIVDSISEGLDCKVTHWTDWSPCSVSCGQGTSEKFRKITQVPRYGGAPCPKRLLKRKRCGKPACL